MFSFNELEISVLVNKLFLSKLNKEQFDLYI